MVLCGEDHISGLRHTIPKPWQKQRRRQKEHADVGLRMVVDLWASGYVGRSVLGLVASRVFSPQDFFLNNPRVTHQATLCALQKFGDDCWL